MRLDRNRRRRGQQFVEDRVARDGRVVPSTGGNQGGRLGDGIPNPQLSVALKDRHFLAARQATDPLVRGLDQRPGLPSSRDARGGRGLLRQVIKLGAISAADTQEDGSESGENRMNGELIQNRLCLVVGTILKGGDVLDKGQTPSRLRPAEDLRVPSEFGHRVQSLRIRMAPEGGEQRPGSFHSQTAVDFPQYR